MPRFARQPSDRALVTKPDRSGNLCHSRRDDACDLRSNIWTQRYNFAGAGLDEANRGSASASAQSAFEHIGALEDRCDDPRIAPRLEHFQHVLGKRTPTRSGTR